MNINKKILIRAIIKSGGFNVMWISEVLLHATILIVYYTISIDVFIIYVATQCMFFLILGVWFVPFMYHREKVGHFDFKKEIQHLEKNDLEILEKLNIIIQKL